MDLSSRIFAYGPLSGRVHAPLSLCMHAQCVIYSEGVHALLSMWVHAYFFSAIYNESWVLISFGDIGVCSCGYTLTISPPHTLPYYPWTNIPRVLFPSSRPFGWDSNPQS